VGGPDAVISAALAAAAATAAAAERAQQAAAAAVAASGHGQMPPWMTASPMGGYASPTFAPPPCERPPGFLKASSPSFSPSAKSAGKPYNESTGKPELPVKSRITLDGDDDRIATIQEDDESPDGEGQVAKSKSCPNMGGDDGLLAGEDGPSLGSSMHGTGTCTPCAWFWKTDGCLNAKDCRYCHLCPEGELKKRKKQKVAKMRLGLATPKGSSPGGMMSPNAQPLSLSDLI